MKNVRERFLQYSGLLAEHGVSAEDLNQIQSLIEKQEKGLFKELPVPEGTEVYVIHCTYECKHDFDCPLTGMDREKCEDDQPCEHMYKCYKVYPATFHHMLLDSVGKTVFLTEEAAQAEAKRLGGQQA